ncbi:TatD related DNase family protein [Leishmania donovani]|uniref:TatD related DNase family protein n=1 Tax=Leishmania donovani TaxID=5661 RepID=A0A504X9F2_LEIDO|nr:TatD related DNase family protein [Leishmania donovani]
MGFVDRGGGREAKGASLRRSKNNPGAPISKNKSAKKDYTTPATRATPTPPPACLPVLKALIAAASAEAAAMEATAASTVTGFEKALAAVRDAAQTGGSPYIDAAVALLSRKLEEDREGIFRRAAEEGKLAAVVCWCGEVERQSLLLSTSAATASSSPAFAGILLYAVLGIHVNSIDRVNMRLHDQWVKELEANVKHGDVVGVLTGLNLSREHGTHYAQERLFKECWRVAAEVRLPLVLHLGAADAASLTETVNRAVKLLDELLTATSATADGARAAPSAVVLHNGLRALHASTAMQQLVRAHRPAARPTAVSVPFYVLATADGLAVAKTEGSETEATATADSGPSVETLAALLPPRAGLGSDSDSATAISSGGDAVVHLSQLLIGTGAPWGTPQNLPDPYLCTLPNEPGNYAYVVQTLYDAMRTPPPPAATAELTLADLSAIAAVNHLLAFFHECVLEQQPVAVAGLADSDAKRDLEALLAEAAKERERMEQERLREEAAQAQARSEELQEKRSRRERKKNVKLNNRSNFTHFRNKDFAPRQSKQEKLAHLREVVSTDVDGRERPPSSSSAASDSDSDSAWGPNSLAAQVERLLEANAAHRDLECRAQRQPAGRGKGKGQNALAGSRKMCSSADMKSGGQPQQQHGARAGGKQQDQRQSSKTPSCRICCACPQERRARDECTLLRNVDECETEIEAFYACLRREGFSAEEVNALKRNTKTM